MVPVPVTVRLVTFPTFQAVLDLAMDHVPEPMAMVRVLLLEEEKAPRESVTL